MTIPASPTLRSWATRRAPRPPRVQEPAVHDNAKRPYCTYAVARRFFASAAGDEPAGEGGLPLSRNGPAARYIVRQLGLAARAVICASRRATSSGRHNSVAGVMTVALPEATAVAKAALTE